MIETHRYILIPLSEVTQPMIDECLNTSFETLRTVEFEGVPIVYTVLLWEGIKPSELWGEFPVYTDDEMRYKLKSAKPKPDATSDN